MKRLLASVLLSGSLLMPGSARAESDHGLTATLYIQPSGQIVVYQFVTGDGTITRITYPCKNLKTALAVLQDIGHLYLTTHPTS